MVTKLEKLQKQQEQLRLRVMKELRKEKTKERKADTRRKILLGAMMLEEMKRDPASYQELTRKLNAYLTKERDRALFNLENNK